LNNVIQGPKSDKLKLDVPFCQKCNNELTQPYDLSWDKASQYLQDHWPIIVTKGYFLWSDIFPKETQKHALHVHLYFVKALGFQILGGKVSLNIKGFSKALSLNL